METTEAAEPISLNGVTYRILEEIGRGGFAMVLKAVDTSGQVVAIKWISRGHPDYKEFCALETRGATICRSADRIGVAGLVKILDYGETDGGFACVMEYFPEGSLDDRIRKDGPLTPAEARRMIVEVGETVGQLHSHDMIHRDISPRNILIRDGRYYLSDFGTLRYLRTRYAQTRLGNVGFSAPECLELEEDAVDGRADIYSLGALLFYTVTGIAPEHREEHLFRVPQPCQSAIYSACRYRRELRPATVEAFLAPIRSRGLARLWYSCRLGRRSRIAALLAVPVVLALLVAFGILGGGVADDPARQEELEALRRTNLRSRVLTEARKHIDDHPQKAMAIALLTENGDDDPDVLEILAEATQKPMPKLILQGHTKPINNYTICQQRKLIVTCGMDRTARVWNLETGEQLAVLEGHNRPEIASGVMGQVLTAEFDPNGDYLYTAGYDRKVLIWRTSDWQLDGELESPHESRWVRWLQFSPDGKMLVTSYEHGRPPECWDVATRTLIMKVKDGRGPVSFTGQGREFFYSDATSKRATARFMTFSPEHDVETEVLKESEHYSVNANSNDFRYCLIGGSQYTYIVDHEQGCVVQRFEIQTSCATPMESSGSFIAVSSTGVVYRLEATNPEPEVVGESGLSWVVSMLGSTAALAVTSDQQLEVWCLKRMAPLFRLGASPFIIGRPDMFADDARLGLPSMCVARLDNDVAVYSIDDLRRRHWRHPSYSSSLNPRGNAGVAAVAGEAWSFDSLTGNPNRVFELDAMSSWIALSSDGSRFATQLDDGSLVLASVTNGDVTAKMQQRKRLASSGTFQRKGNAGEVLTIGSFDNEVIMLSSDDFVELACIPIGNNVVAAARISESGKLLLCPCYDWHTYLFNLEAKEERWKWLDERSAPQDAAFSIDEREIYVCTASGEVFALNTETGMIAGRFPNCGEDARKCSLAHGGRRLAVISNDDRLRILDIASRSLWASLPLSSSSPANLYPTEHDDEILVQFHGGTGSVHSVDPVVTARRLIKRQVSRSDLPDDLADALNLD